MRRYSLVGLLFLYLFSFGASTAVAQEAAEQADIAGRCEQTQRYLAGTLKPKDLRTRVDRLQTYRYVYQRLDTFVKRLEHNYQPKAGELRTSLDQMAITIEAFKDSYESYDKAREDLSGLSDCSNHANEFQSRLDAARQTRQKVNDDVSKLQTLLGVNLKSQLEELHKALLASNKNGAAR